MCIIAHTAKKKYMHRANVEQCMKSNSSGFFMCELLPGGKRNSIRTMSMKDAMAFFDKIDDDHEFVMHARIPSFGATCIDNVHGWEEDGIMFCHNMSLRELDSQMKAEKWNKTDSEYFFRFVFIPVYRAFGKEAYKDGVFCEYLDRLIRIFCGSSNKFAFIMPDNNVVKYGNWVTDFDGKCEFSNNSYKVPSYSSGYGFGSAAYNDDDYASWYGRKQTAQTTPTVTSSTHKSDGTTLYGELGEKTLMLVALQDLVLYNVKELVAFGRDGTTGGGERISLAVDDAGPGVFDRSSADAASVLVELMSSNKIDASDVTDAIIGYSAELEKRYLTYTKRTYGGLYPSDARDILRDIEEGIEAQSALLNVGFDVDATDPARFATAFTMERTKKGGFKMSKVDTVDLLCYENLDIATTMKGIANVLAAVHDKGTDKPDEPVSYDPEKMEAAK